MLDFFMFSDRFTFIHVLKDSVIHSGDRAS